MLSIFNYSIEEIGNEVVVGNRLKKKTKLFSALSCCQIYL